MEEEDRAKVGDAAAWGADLQDQEVIVSVHPVGTVSLIRGAPPAPKDLVLSAEHR
jgi:hypothetical protein